MILSNCFIRFRGFRRMRKLSFLSCSLFDDSLLGSEVQKWLLECVAKRHFLLFL